LFTRNAEERKKRRRQRYLDPLIDPTPHIAHLRDADERVEQVWLEQEDEVMMLCSPTLGELFCLSIVIRQVHSHRLHRELALG